MSIVGIGSDIVAIARIRRLAADPDSRFARRVLCEAERSHGRRQADFAAFVARRFAAKEAGAKALGTGIAAGIGFHDLMVSNDGRGAPSLALTGRAAERADALGVHRCHLTISDEREYAVAFVVLEG
ncbi:holo-ACP synthase [Arhodomonas sp. AD133]|uniref:holo-ACP synthase n=1 Tax=Arhodomonas sp. AD133 TaxID=3415009 RepID=UPI003EBDDFA0